MIGAAEARGITVIVGLAARDFAHERTLSTCAILGMAAILAPLLVLFGLKFGVVSSLTARLASDPRTRAVQPIGQGRYDDAWLGMLAARPETGFLVPTTRFLAATVTLRSAGGGGDDGIVTELSPTQTGEPLLEGGGAAIGRTGLRHYAVALSRSVADRLRVAPGDTLEGRIGRSVDGTREAIALTFSITEIIRAGLTDREIALVPLSLLIAVEDYREGVAAPELETGGSAPASARSFASFRLYARTIDDVAALRDWLALEGVATTTRLADIEAVQRLNRDLTRLFLLISSLAGIGYLVWTALASLSTVARKQRELSLLRLIGFSTLCVVVFPMVQAVLTALLGAALASAAVFATTPLIAQMFAGQLPPGTTVFRLLPQHLIAAALITAGFAALAASVSGVRASLIAPSEGLRDE
jgi:putative ABC transport system permease protein